VQAFDMSPTQMEETVKTYFSSLAGWALRSISQEAVELGGHSAAGSSALPFGADDIA